LPDALKLKERLFAVFIVVYKPRIAIYESHHGNR